MNKFEDSFMLEAKLQRAAAFINKHSVWSFCEARNDNFSSVKAVPRRMSVSGSGRVHVLEKASKDASRLGCAEQSSLPGEGKDASLGIRGKGC